MREYDGWSFRNKSFISAVALSLLWHFFWFFAVNITVTSGKRRIKTHPVVVSLGPVLDDTIFRTLADTKPQISETVYRRLSDLTSFLDVQIKTMERPTGDVVSVPFSKNFWSSLRGIVGGEKSAPAHEFTSRININYGEEAPVIEGEAKSRRILNRPDEPAFPEGFDVALRNSQTEFQFTVDGAGVVSDVETLISSGSLDIDLLWVRYLRSWQFSPLDNAESLQSAGRAPLLSQRGRVKLRFNS